MGHYKRRIYELREEKPIPYTKLLEKYHEFFPAATLTQMKSKLNVIRTNFRSELRKVNENRKGVGADELYVSDKFNTQFNLPTLYKHTFKYEMIPYQLF